MSVNVIFGSDAGATRAVANRIAKRLQGRAVDVAAATVADFESPRLLVLGAPTYGMGDLQSDWEANYHLLEEANLASKRVALFGTGDQFTYPDTFVDAMGVLYDTAVARGAEVIGFTDVAGYDFTASFAERGGQFVGLALDEDQEPNKTGDRITAWVEQLRNGHGL
ncbi:flavodoxin FldA [Roseospira marina]|uniref:Flavodoxin n=1 Tax=Roseospira marina TaxID=140057 RepID=A0A5M6IEM6_9PROT|nr:flavodoxin FldA [Roseospira marina]KAA5606427.1 flavodoxin FldA [Roseospira marina]MBB4314159.1 flavodoxin I [Roseospira marina]MBB5087320.1 flavodoxin I [Roseospira marina]